ncbi:MAG TPA: glycosyltransferase family 2 protein [Bradyrhizobium sp.]|nr:glycosyltransferase family 2 protein [Bradyrhizobium sp.]
MWRTKADGAKDDGVARPPTLADYHAVAARRAAPSTAAPDISVVTVVKNGAATLRRTIASVHAQKGPSIEHIIIDGGSTDGTIDLVKSLLRPGDYWQSEPDYGISDAFNKGIALARGRAIQILNADDWLPPGQLAIRAAVLTESATDFAFGDCLAYEGDRPAFRYRGHADFAAQIGRHMHAINHPSLLARRSAYLDYGLFSLRHHYAMDYEWILRVHRAGGRGVYDPRIVANLSLGGVSHRQYRRSEREVRDTAITYGRNPSAAELEYRYHLVKSTFGRLLMRQARPVYDRVRSWINPHFEPYVGRG